jgi:hypothetical protein
MRKEEVPERLRQATFDRDVAIRRTDAEFLAIGHPFVNAMLEYAGSYDFGGLCAGRRIIDPVCGGRSGWLFVFIVRQRVATVHNDECLFGFQPVFVRSDGVIDDEAARSAVSRQASEPSPGKKQTGPDEAFQQARTHLVKKLGLWDWDEDVEFLAMSWVEFR